MTLAVTEVQAWILIVELGIIAAVMVIRRVP